jgi:hypothetical protein
MVWLELQALAAILGAGWDSRPAARRDSPSKAGFSKERALSP